MKDVRYMHIDSDVTVNLLSLSSLGLAFAGVCKQALYEHRPSDADVQPTEAWLAVMEQAHCNMARSSPPNSSSLVCCAVWSCDTYYVAVLIECITCLVCLSVRPSVCLSVHTGF